MSAILRWKTIMSLFQLVGIDHAPFEPLFGLSDAELADQGIVRRIADTYPGFPCRVSLEDAAVGEELLLLNFPHLLANSPYRASGPIFVRKGHTKRVLAPGVVPDYVARRLMSVRAYDSAHMMMAADVLDGSVVAAHLEQLFANPEVAYVHLHNAKRGCFSCLARRV